MRRHRLHHIFEPVSVAVVGASQRENSVGYRILDNLRAAGFTGPVYPVNRNHPEVLGHRCYASLLDIEEPVDLAVLAIPAESAPAVVSICVQKQVGGILVISAGFGEVGPFRQALQDEMVAMARAASIPLVGPNCLGVIRPARGLNATFAHSGARPGHVALVSQSSAFCTALLDAAESCERGFSLVASLGATADVGFGQVLDYLSLDAKTRSVLLYIEAVSNARAFLSGLRAACRLKPVIVVKPGRYEAGRRAAVTHTGGHFTSDDVFNAALERAGAVRVQTVSQLNAAANLLSSSVRVTGTRLAIVTNGGGPGVMAADHAGEHNVSLAELSPESVAALGAVMPAHWIPTVPVDLLGDADRSRYQQAVKILLADHNVDGLLVLLTPQGMTDPTACAEGVVAAAAGSRKPVLACWLGQDLVREGRSCLDAGGIPHFSSPEAGVDGFGYLAAYRRNQDKLMQTPPPLSWRNPPRLEAARETLRRALACSRAALDPAAVRDVLEAFHIPFAQRATRRDGVGGRRETATRILSMSIDRDPVFGPVIRVGGGGAAYPAPGPIQIALPPLNLFLCQELIQRAGLVRGPPATGAQPGSEQNAIVDILMRVSEMACELPEIERLTIDPVWVDEEGVLAIDAGISISSSPVKPGEYGHMAIHPYPPGLEYNLLTRAGVPLIVRPIRPEDATIEQRFVEGLSPQSKYFRFMYGMAHLPPAMLARFTQIDYDREMALVAVQDDGGPEASLKAVARYVGNPGSESCEFALVVADDMQRQSIGRQLLERLIELARHRGFREMEGEVLLQNRRMLELCRSLGFRVQRSLEDSEVMAVTLGL